MPQTGYELARSTLDFQYGRLPPGKELDLDAQAREALQSMQGRLMGLMEPGPPIDYSSVGARAAYLHMYLGAHSSYTRRLLHRLPRPWQDRIPDPLTVSVFGAGPGSDLVGLLRFLYERRVQSAADPSDPYVPISGVRAYLCDRILDWRLSWADIRSNLSIDVEAGVANLDVAHEHIDLTDQSTWAGRDYLFSADLFLVSYCASELARFGPAADPFWDALSRHARPGTMLLVMDNDHADFNAYVYDNVIRSAWHPVSRDHLRSYNAMDDAGPVADYGVRFGRHTKINSHLVYGLFEKQP